MYMVMFVLDDPSILDAVLDAWDAIGVSGVTIIESTGINRRRLASQVGKSFMAGLNRWVQSAEENQYTLFTIVQNEALVLDCIKAVEQIIGDLNQPNRGVLAAWPLGIVKGIPETGKKKYLEE
jgi:hypothetical protein